MSPITPPPEFLAGDDPSWPSEARAALDRNARFNLEFVEGLNVCPFAAPGRKSQMTRRFALPDRLTSAGSLDLTDQLAELAGSIPDIDVLQVVFPRVECTAKRWARAVKDLTATVQARVERSPLAVAAFHPELEFRMTTPAAMVGLFRRSPDPMIQWVSLPALARLRQGRPDGDVPMPRDAEDIRKLLTMSKRQNVGEQVAAHNAALVERLGVAAVEAILTEMRVVDEKKSK